MTLAELVRLSMMCDAQQAPCSPPCPLQLFRKVLRARDAKSSESQQSGDTTTLGKGRSQVRPNRSFRESMPCSRSGLQVMNLLTIDTNTIASLATRIFNFTNAGLSCEFDFRHAIGDGLKANGTSSQVVIGLTFLYSLLGWSTFVGIAFVPLFAPCSYLISKFIYR
jgi:hypothetical protein